MLYAVTIEPLNAIYFVSDRPDDNPWEVEEGVELDINPLYGTWTPDLGPLHQTLCVSTSDPKYFRVFLHSKDIGIREFRPTGRHFGGLFSKATWERFAKTCPRHHRGPLQIGRRAIRRARGRSRSPRSSEEAEAWRGSSCWIPVRWAMLAGGEAPDRRAIERWLIDERRMGRSWPSPRSPTTRSDAG